MIKHSLNTIKVGNARTGYIPKELCIEADICVNHCPQPKKDCKGESCSFFREEYLKRTKNK